jgi:hypothetical protein
MRALVLVLVLVACGPEVSPMGAAGVDECSPWESGRCACDGGVPGVEVCERTDAGLRRACRCH